MPEHHLSETVGQAIFVESADGWSIELHFEDGIIAPCHHRPFRTYRLAVTAFEAWERHGLVGQKFGH